MKIRFLKNITFKTLSEITSRGITFLVFALMARFLGPLEFGKISYALALSSLLVIFLDLGWNQMLTRHLASGGGDKLVLEVISLKIKATIIVFLFAAVAGFFMAGKIYFWLLMLAMIVLVSQYWQDFLAAIAMGREKFQEELFLKLIPRFIALGGISVFFWLPASTLSLMSVYGLGLALGVIGVCIYYLPVRRWFFCSISSSGLIGIVKQSLPLGLMTLCWVVYMRVDMVILGAFQVPPEDLGHYGAVSKLMDVMRSIPLMQQAALLPIFAGYAGDADKITRHIVKLCKYILPAAAVGILGVILFAPFIIRFAYGSDYLAAIPVFRVALLGTFFSYANASIMAGLIALRKEALIFWSSIILLVVNVASNIFLIPIFSIQAPAVAIILSEGVWLFANIFMLASQWKR